MLRESNGHRGIAIRLQKVQNYKTKYEAKHLVINDGYDIVSNE